MMTSPLNNLLIICLIFLLSASYASGQLKLNEGLPVMVDEKTELNDILLNDMSITYTYQIKDMDVTEAKQLKEKNRAFIQENACNDEDIQCLIKKDLDIRFIYKIKDEEILSVKLNKDICSHQQNQCMLGSV